MAGQGGIISMRLMAGRLTCSPVSAARTAGSPTQAAASGCFLPIHLLRGDMTLNHVHFQVRDLEAAVGWFATILELRPGFQNDRIATFIFGAMTIIIDAGTADSPATLGFESDDCDRDFKTVVARGAVPIATPVNKEWGVRTAYFKGP